MGIEHSMKTVAMGNGYPLKVRDIDRSAFQNSNTGHEVEVGLKRDIFTAKRCARLL